MLNLVISMIMCGFHIIQPGYANENTVPAHINPKITRYLFTK